MRLSSSDRPSSDASRRAGSIVERADRQGLHGVLAARSAQDGTDARVELIGGERLDEVVVRARVEQADDLVLLVAGGRDDHRNLAHGTQHLEHLSTIDVGQTEVEHDDVGAVGQHLAEAHQAGRGAADRMAPLGERVRDRFAYPQVVLDERDHRHPFTIRVCGRFGAAHTGLAQA